MNGGRFGIFPNPDVFGPMDQADAQLPPMEPDTDPADPFLVDGAGPQAEVPPELSGQADERASGHAATMLGEQAREFPDVATTAPGVIQGGHRAEDYGGWQQVRELRKGQNDLEAMPLKEGKLMAAQADEEANARAEELARARYEVIAESTQRAREREQSEARLKDLTRAAEQMGKEKIDSGRVFHSPGGVIGSIAALFMPLFSSDPESGQRMLNTAINRDIDLQKAELAQKNRAFDAKRGLYADYLNLVKDDQAARMLTEAKMKDIAAGKILEIAARHRSPQIMAAKEKEAALLRRDGAILAMDVFKKMFHEPKYVNKALAAWWGPSAYSRVGQGQEPTERFDDTMETGTPTVEPGGWDVSQGGNVFGSDVDYIKGPDDDERPMNLTGSNEMVMLPTQEFDATVGQDPVIRSGIKPGSGADFLGKNGTLAIEAAERMHLDKTDGLRRYKEAYADPTIAAELNKRKWDTIAAYAKSLGNPKDPKVLRKAFGMWLKDVDQAETVGVGAIAKASDEIAGVEHVATEMARHMAIAEANLGPKVHDLTSKINFASPNWRLQLNQAKLQFGVGDEKAVKEMEDVYMRYAFLRTQQGKAMLGAITGTDNEKLEAMFPPTATWKQIRERVAYVSSQVHKRRQGINKVGGPLAELLWRAQHQNISAPGSYPGIRKRAEREGKTERVITAKTTVIK